MVMMKAVLEIWFDHNQLVLHQQMPLLVANKLVLHYINHLKPELMVCHQPNQASPT